MNIAPFSSAFLIVSQRTQTYKQPKIKFLKADSMIPLLFNL